MVKLTSTHESNGGQLHYEMITAHLKYIFYIINTNKIYITSTKNNFRFYTVIFNLTHKFSSVVNTFFTSWLNKVDVVVIYGNGYLMLGRTRM